VFVHNNRKFNKTSFTEILSSYLRGWEDDTYFKVDGLYTTDSLQSIMREFSIKGVRSKRLVESIFPFDLKKAKFPLKGLEYRILLDSLMQ
jgi:hypothetical protein